MNYTIMYATSTKNPSIIIDLDKNGNMYTVLVWHRGEHMTIRKQDFRQYDSAKAVFDVWCKEFNMTMVQETEQTWDARDFDRRGQIIMKTGYEMYPLDRLFRCYQHENDRINKEEAAITKSLIRKEILRRTNKAFELLDTLTGLGDVEEKERVNKIFDRYSTGRV